MILRSSLTLGLAFLLSATLFSKNIYIKFDQACMDRLEYRLNGNMAGNGLISYSLRANDSERVVMEIGVESIKQVKRMPKGTKTCGKMKVNDLLANSINSGKDKVYIVRQVGKNYIVSPVHLATYMKDSKTSVSMRGNQYGMSYATSDIGVMENNLADRSSETKVYFVGTEKQVCSDAILLKKIPIETCKPYTDMTFVPGLGIITEKTGLNQAEAEGNILQLVKVNNMPLAEYMDRKCGGGAEILVEQTPAPMKEESPRFQPATRNKPAVTAAPNKSPEVIFPVDNTPPAPEYRPAGSDLLFGYDQPQKPEPTFRPKGADCNQLSYQGVHIVQTSQTLYSIARQYSITVAQLRAWNKLGQKDLIKPCQSLYVLPPNSVANNTSAADGALPKAANAEVLYRNTAPAANTPQATASTNVANSDDVYTDIAKKSEVLYPKSGAQPTAYNTTKAAVKPADTCNKLDYDGVHIVQKGETLYSIALANDLTVNQLKKLNKLNDKSTIKPCTSLYTKSPAVVKAATEKAMAAPSNTPDLTAKGATKPNGDCTGIAFDGMHIVQRGETLYSIAKANGLTVKQLQQWNKLGENGRIVPCMSLYTKTPEVVIAKANNTQSTNTDGANYTIPNSEISTGYTNTPANSNPTQVLANTNVSTGTAGMGATDKMWNSGVEYHIVQKGETLTNLAKMYGFTLERFRDINGLGDSNIIRIGQVLRTGNCLCPANGVGPTNVSTSSINTGVINSQNGSVVNTNDEMTARGGTTTNTNTTTERPPNYDPVPVPYSYETEAVINNSKRGDHTISYRNGRKVHTVQENETMAMIANKYNLPIELLRQLNKMEKNEIVIPDMKIYLE